METIPPILSQNANFYRIQMQRKTFTWKVQTLENGDLENCYRQFRPINLGVYYSTPTIQNKNLQSNLIELCTPFLRRNAMNMYYECDPEKRDENILQMAFCPVIDYICSSDKNQSFFEIQLQRLLNRFPYENNALVNSFNINKSTQDVFSFLPIPQDFELRNYLLKFMPEDDLLQLANIPEDQLCLGMSFLMMILLSTLCESLPG